MINTRKQIPGTIGSKESGADDVKTKGVGKMDVARKVLVKEISAELIARMTGFPVELIQNLKLNSR